MVGFRGNSAWNPVTQARAYAGKAGADLENAPQGPVPFTSPFGLPVARPQIWRPVVNQPGTATRGVPGRPVQRASGNPSVYTDPEVRGPKLPYGGRRGPTFNGRGASSWPGNPMTQTDPNSGMPVGIPPDSQGPAFISQFGSPRVLQQGQESAVRAPGNAPVGYSNDKLVTYDRHAMAKVGYENSGRMSGNTDPPLDGPARPSYMLVQRALNYQQGTDTTAATDDLNRDYSRNVQGMYVGEQGTGWSRIYGGVPGLYQEYGSYQGMSPTSPEISGGIHSPVGQGQPGDGPHDLWGGPPHGLHSPTLPTYSQTLGRYMDIPQMARPRIDRPSNSPIAGQSYSQTVISQGQTGFNKKAQTVRRFAGAGGGGWRGRAQGLWLIRERNTACVPWLVSVLLPSFT